MTHKLTNLKPVLRKHHITHEMLAEQCGYTRARLTCLLNGTSTTPNKEWFIYRKAMELIMPELTRRLNEEIMADIMESRYFSQDATSDEVINLEDLFEYLAVKVAKIISRKTTVSGSKSK